MVHSSYQQVNSQPAECREMEQLALATVQAFPEGRALDTGHHGRVPGGLQSRPVGVREQGVEVRRKEARRSSKNENSSPPLTSVTEHGETGCIFRCIFL